MDMLEAMRSRHAVRAYTNKPIPDDIVSLLTRRVAHDNQKYGTAITLRTEDTTAFGPIFKLIRAKGVRNFLIMSANLREGRTLENWTNDWDMRAPISCCTRKPWASIPGRRAVPTAVRLWTKWRKATGPSPSSPSDTERSKASLTNPNPFPKSANTTVRPLHGSRTV